MGRVGKEIKAQKNDAAGISTISPSNGRKRRVVGSPLGSPSQQPKRRRVRPARKPKAESTEGKHSDSVPDCQQEVQQSEEYIKKAGSKKSVHEEQQGERSSNEPEETLPKTKETKKGSREKGMSTMPLAVRASGLSFKIGAHVSGAKGVHNAVTNAVHIGANAFAMFLKSQRKCSNHRYEAGKFVLPHGSYLVNLAQEDPEKAQQANESFLDDLKRCESLGIKLYNFHPGTTGGAPRKSAIERIAASLNRAHSATPNVITVLETMAGSGNVIGSSFEDLRDIINLIQDQSRVGVCIDTAHIFAAGYDLRVPSAYHATFEKFDSIVGLKYLRAFHLNDSKAPLGSNRDLHQNIGLGFLGLKAFHSIMNDARFENIPMVLETPIDKKDENGKDVEDKAIWAAEIKMLESLIDLDPNSKHFRTMESDLAQKGLAERNKFEESFQKKLAKKKKQEQRQSKLSFKQH